MQNLSPILSPFLRYDSLMKNSLDIYLVITKPYTFFIIFSRLGLVAGMLQWIRIKGHLFTQEHGLSACS